MKITVRFFAALRDLAGGERFDVEVPNDEKVEAVWARFAGESPGLEAYRDRLLVSRNLEYVDLDTRLADGDELAFFPPVSGG